MDTKLCCSKILNCDSESSNNYTRFFVRKIGYTNFVPKSVRRPSVHPFVRHVFFVIVSSPEPLDVATSNFADA